MYYAVIDIAYKCEIKCDTRNINILSWYNFKFSDITQASTPFCGWRKPSFVFPLNSNVLLREGGCIDAIRLC